MSGREPQTIVVTISTVHPGPGGGAIFTGQDASRRWVRAKAGYDRMPLPPVRGQVWELTGRFAYDEVYGLQFHVESCGQVEPTGDLLYNYLRHHPAFRGFGFGDAKIAKLRRRFGHHLGHALANGDAASLSEVLTRAQAEKLLAVWCSNARESSVVAFLSEHGVDARLFHKILKLWGAEAVEKLRENPYRLLVVAPWESADRLARSVGVEPLDPRRLVAATEAWGYRRLDKHKDTRTDATNLKNGVRRLLGSTDDHVAERAIELSLREKAVVGDASSGYQPVGCALMEGYLADRFRAMLPGVERQMDLFRSAGQNRLIDDEIDAFEEGENLRLNAEQRRAVHMAATCQLSVLKGGAGVGKTAVLKAVLRVVRRMNGRAFQTALAGRAAQRMREATKEDAYTIVGFLNRIRNDKVQPRPGDLVVIDESSMLDLLLTYRLVKALPKGVRLLLVGDPAQLPPIGPGLVFHVLASGDAAPATELIEVHRQAASTGIPDAALCVRQGLIPDFTDYEGIGRGVSFLDCHPREIIRRLVEIMHDLGGFGDAQILGVLNSGAVGVRNVNAVFHQRMSPTKPCLPGWGLAEGDPIIFTTNDYERELFNGSLGIVENVCRGDHGGGTSSPAKLNFDGRSLDMSEEDLGNVELAYAITVHKAQGSQFRRVVIPVTKSRLLDRTLIYTALTRGVEQVVFLGDRGEFCSAVLRQPSASLRSIGFTIG